MNTLIKNGYIVTEDNELNQVDIWIEDKVIKVVGKLEESTISFEKIIDANGGLITPGLVDVHVHFREPGFEYKETIATGSASAAKGGFTTVCAMPNLNPVPDTKEKLAHVNELIKKDSVVKIKQYAPITKQLKSEELVDFEALKNEKAFAFTNDGVGVQTAGTMYLAMKEAAKLNMAIVAHTEDESLLFGGVMHQGEISKKLGLPGIMSATESSQIARDVLLAKETGVHYHVCHVSTKESVEVIRQAKKQGIHVTCEVCPHHLILKDKDITKDHGSFKMNPPLRASDDQKALIEGLLDGTIDCIATDHAPHSHEEKNQSMLKSPFGIIGSESAFQLMYTHFVKTNRFTLEQVVYWMTQAPSKLFGLKTGTLNIGSAADIAIFDLSKEMTISDDFVSKSNNTPFIGEQVYGETIYTLVDGQVVWHKGE
ncbi:dihydroorotase [Vagococcus carniphilus]|uniref:dihydroorotase n=1 Tax=Vagococcus carniphilus TaxID=218144 RepID=UPI0028909283|nr:dihydroorotase [Vagococcus carniphilus]MDT2814692.1 dihydroorotase [Vagococcus carniphilus]MDT2864909.1 dihydroorotase [Vagococcus carniphilus]